MWCQVLKKVTKLAFEKETSPDAHVRDGAEEFTLRMEMVGVQQTFVDASSVSDDTWAHQGGRRLTRLVPDRVRGCSSRSWQGMYGNDGACGQELQVVGTGRGERVRVLWRLFEDARAVV